MPVRIELPEDATFSKRVMYPFVRACFFFMFGKLAYGRIVRVNKPDLRGSFIWASSHSNFLCDAVMPIYEAATPAKYLAKATIFRGPFKPFFEFLGGLPIVRAEDMKSGVHKSSLNRSTFKTAIEALKDGWPVTIFPEGTSIPSPGLVLPLKAGVAKLGFAAEDAYDFRLDLRIVPVGLEYGSRVRVGSGVTIRYGNPIYFKKYKEVYDKDSNEAVRLVLEELTKEMIAVFPHFENEHTLSVGKKLTVSGLTTSKHQAAQLFLKKRNDSDFEPLLSRRFRDFEEKTKEIGIPVPSWGYRAMWRRMRSYKKVEIVWITILGIPLAVWHVIHNVIPEYLIRGIVDLTSADETEAMTRRFILAPLLLPFVYAMQLWGIKIIFPEIADTISVLHYLAYVVVNLGVWKFMVDWKRGLKILLSVAFFKSKASRLGEAASAYESLQSFLKH